MASKFIEKHKRKSLLFLLLLLFRGRNKYIVLLVMVLIFSIPFVATSDMVARFFDTAPGRYLVKLFGLESVVASINPEYSHRIAKSTFERLKEEYEANKIWNKIFGGIGVEEREGMGTVAMVKVGDEFKDEYLSKQKDKSHRNKKTKADLSNSDVDDISLIDEEDVKNGKGVDGVDLNGILEGNRGGSYGTNSENGSFPGSGSSLNLLNSSPYLSKNSFGSSSSGANAIALAGKSSMAKSALDNIKTNIPQAPDPALKKGRIKTSRMGNLTAFGWKNVGYTKKGVDANINISGNKRALFQMGETLATTSIAYKQNPAYEYQKVYTGATYDGTSLNGDIVQTAGESNTTLPDTGYVSETVDSTQHWEEIAKNCQDAQRVHGTEISRLQDQIDDISKTMTNPPKCCKNVSPWNNKVSRLVELCNKLNAESIALARGCQNPSPQTIDCQSSYGRMYIKPCSKRKCWFGFILAIIGLLIGFLLGGFVGAIIGAAIGFAIGSVASIYFQMAAMGAAFAGVGAYFADKKSEKAIKVTEEINKDVSKK